MSTQSRREFLERSMLATAAAAVAGSPARAASKSGQSSTSPNEKIQLACIGVRGRGGDHLHEFGKFSDCEIVAIVDVDEAVGRQRVAELYDRTGNKPTYYRDLRKMLEDKSIDAVSIATPNHWHSLAAIWAIQHGKDVYVEKPVSHNVSEGRRVVQAARKHGRIVQAGTQCRSNPGMQAAINYVHSGKIGQVKVARGLCYKRRGSIGPAGHYDPPKSVDYNLWLGPAPQRSLSRKRLHYDWHWIWDYGNGDLGNQGIHQMDICRWGLGVDDIGTSVVSYGGRLGYEDAGETANTQVSIHRYPQDRRIVFEVRGLATQKLRGVGVGVIFYGTEGDVVIPSYNGGAAFDPSGKLVAKFSGGGDEKHFRNFLDAVRSRRHEDLNGDILEGHLSSALCHLGNVSYRLGELISGPEVASRLGKDVEAQETYGRFASHLAENKVQIESAKVVRFGRRLSVDSKSETFSDSGASEANALLTRAYRPPFVVPPEKDV